MIPNGNNYNESAASGAAKKDPERQNHQTAATPLLHLGGPMMCSTMNSGSFNRRANPLNSLPAELGRLRGAKLSNTRLFLS